MHSMECLPHPRHSPMPHTLVSHTRAVAFIGPVLTCIFTACFIARSAGARKARQFAISASKGSNLGILPNLTLIPGLGALPRNADAAFCKGWTMERACFPGHAPLYSNLVDQLSASLSCLLYSHHYSYAQAAPPLFKSGGHATPSEYSSTESLRTRGKMRQM